MAPTTIQDDGVASVSQMSIHDKEEGEASDRPPTGAAADVVLDPKLEQKLLAKLDIAFVPIIMLTYLSCFLDRSNIGSAFGG